MIIDTEAHFYTTEYHDYILSRKETPREEAYKGYYKLWYEPQIWEPHGLDIDNRLLDLGEGRLQNMDEAGIDMQVLSLSTPGCEQFSQSEGTAQARKTNEELSEVVNKHPDRFIGLAALAPQSPDDAARELERAVKELGLKGVKINSHIRGSHLDDRKYWPIFEVAESLDVPVFLHPNTPSPSMIEPYLDYGFALAGPAWGFGAETALHVMRLLYSGLLDEHPRLKIALGHLGEGLIFWLYRLDFCFDKPWMDEEIRPAIKRLPSEYLKENFYINNSGMYSVPALLNVLMEIGAEHMMFAADYPYENSREAVDFIKTVPISDTDREKIQCSVAKMLFKIG